RRLGRVRRLFLKTGCRSRGPCSEREHNERLEPFDSGQTSDVARFGPKGGKTKVNKIYGVAERSSVKRATGTSVLSWFSFDGDFAVEGFLVADEERALHGVLGDQGLPVGFALGIATGAAEIVLV